MLRRYQPVMTELSISGRLFPSLELSEKFSFIQDFVVGSLLKTPWTIDGSATASRHKVQGVELIPTKN
jgi:hypothetical protein